MSEADVQPAFPRPVATRLAIATSIALLALAIFVGNDNHVRIGDTFPARLLPISILDEGDLDFNEFQHLAGPGHRLEESYQFNRVGDRIVSYYSIVPGILNVPAHVIARAMGRNSSAEMHRLARVTASVITAASVLLMTLALLGLCERTTTAVLFGALYAFGTTTWSVASTALWQHGPSLLFITGAIAALSAKRRIWALAAGLMLGMAVWNRLPNASYALSITLYVAICRRRDLPWLVAGGAAPALLMSIYSLSHWESLWALGEGHQTALMSGPLVFNLAGHLLSPNRGFFVFSPVFLLALPMLFKVLIAPRREPLLFALSVGALGILLAHSLWFYWWGGECFGYRLLTEVVPVWIVLLARSWEDWIAESRAGTSVLAVLAVLSVYVHFLGAFYYPSGWNTTPTSIDDDPSRAWDYRDTEIGRLHRRFTDGP